MLNAAMVGVSLLVLAWVVYTSLPRARALYNRNGGDTARQAPPPTLAETRVHYSIDRIVSAHLFGTPAKQAAPQRAPETKLHIRLLGMISSDNDELARAMIGVNAGEVSAYGVGDDIKGTDATVHAVGKKRVLLERDGAMESLYLRLPRVDLNLAKAGSARG